MTNQKPKVFIKYADENLIINWERLSKMKREDVVALRDSWKEAYKANKEILEENSVLKESALKQIEESMVSAGIDIYKWKNSKWKREKNGYASWFITRVVNKLDKTYGRLVPGIPNCRYIKKEVNGISVEMPFDVQDIVDVYDQIIKQTTVKKEVKLTPLAEISLKYAKENNIDIAGLSTVQMINKVEEIAKEEYLEKECPEGTKVHLDNECEYCEDYVVGERRCECGNRRISITVDGNLEQGFYWYPEGY